MTDWMASGATSEQGRTIGTSCNLSLQHAVAMLNQSDRPFHLTSHGSVEGGNTILERIDPAISFAAGSSAGACAASVNIYVINLDRSPQRWERLHGQAGRFGLNVIRIAAVDGATVPESDWVGFDPRQFMYHNGRKSLPGEYGCYRSHMMALQRFVESGDEAGLIIEDDLDLNPQLIPRALAALKAVPGAGLVKLVSHRRTAFRPASRTTENDVIGRCLHGPQGSAACYAVTRRAAQALLIALKPMQLPYDVALERGWATGVETFSTQTDLAGFSPFRRETTIGTRASYRATKKHFMLRMTTHWFRTHDQIRRWFYAIRQRRLI